MHDTMLSVSYESLGRILEQLQDSSEIRASSELTARIRNAILFHRQISVDLQGLLEEYQNLKRTVSDLTREPGERVCNQLLRNQFGKYEEMRNLGVTPREVYFATRADGLDGIESIRALREVFNLSLQEAQEIISRAELELRQQAA